MNEPAGKMQPPEKGVVVRMYCTGLGDCFLLGFPGSGGETSYVLIDCGVWKGTRGAEAWMRTILEHVRDEVGDRGLELLVATHAHWDHLSGFSQAQDVFKDLKVKRVWLPWTEDPKDRAALRMVEERRLALRATVAAACRLREKLGPEDQTVANLEAVLGFAGGLGAGPSTDDLMKIVREKTVNPTYVRPGLKPLTLNSLLDVRIYALGPPTDPKRLGKDSPSTAPGQSEVYLSARSMNEDAALLAACDPVIALTPEEEERREMAFPFENWQRYSPGQDAADPELDKFFETRYLEPSKQWRQIDTDWLEVASQWALNLDDHVNNTSLVLAFELGEGGPVLLFPGDAQVGNWLSWHELESVGGVTAESLLNRTVLYKVGHHGSHNATLKDKGLKMMTSPSLVAMIPVDEKEACKPKGRNAKGWAMPYDKLLDDLKVRTQGRILRADQDCEPSEKTFPYKISFEIDGAVEERILFIQHTVTGEV
jgi:beta-lactamase superfamily II metal-dependent hydrolase